MADNVFRKIIESGHEKVPGVAAGSLGQSTPPVRGRQARELLAVVSCGG
jgi:hypothetical protein